MIRLPLALIAFSMIIFLPIHEANAVSKETWLCDSKKLTHVGAFDKEIYTEEEISNLSALLEIHSNGNVNLNTKFAELAFIADEIDEFGSYTNFFARIASSKTKETGEVFHSNGYSGIEQLLTFSSAESEGILSNTLLNIVSQYTDVRFYRCSKL